MDLIVVEEKEKQVVIDDVHKTIDKVSETLKANRSKAKDIVNELDVLTLNFKRTWRYS